MYTILSKHTFWLYFCFDPKLLFSVVGGSTKSYRPSSNEMSLCVHERCGYRQWRVTLEWWMNFILYVRELNAEISIVMVFERREA